MENIGEIRLSNRRVGVTLSFCQQCLPELQNNGFVGVICPDKDEKLVKKYQSIFKSLGVDTTYEEVFYSKQCHKMHFDDFGEVVWMDHWIEKKFSGYKFIKQ